MAIYEQQYFENILSLVNINSHMSHMRVFTDATIWSSSNIAYQVITFRNLLQLLQGCFLKNLEIEKHKRQAEYLAFFNHLSQWSLRYIVGISSKRTHRFGLPVMGEILDCFVFVGICCEIGTWQKNLFSVLYA